MRTAFKPSRLSNLYKPLIILLSAYAFVNLVGFFVQHTFNKQVSTNGVSKMNVPAGGYLIIEKKNAVSPAPPKIKPQPKKRILPSGQVEP